MAPARIKRAMVRLMAKGWPVCIRFSASCKAFSLWKNQRRWRLQSLKHYLFQLYPAHESIPDVSSIVFFGIIQRVMQTAAFFTTQCRIDNHCRRRGQIAQF